MRKAVEASEKRVGTVRSAGRWFKGASRKSNPLKSVTCPPSLDSTGPPGHSVGMTAPAPSRYHDRIAPVLDYVRENLDRPLGIEELARVVHFSPYHFHRVFTSVTGETVALHVRRVRLERAIQLMKGSPNESLGRIALRAGFGSASDFSRTFRRHFEISPSRWDRRSPLVFRKNCEEEIGEKPYAVRELVAAGQGAAIEARTEIVPARTVAFLRIRMPFLDNALEKGYLRFRSWMESRGLEKVPGGLWGMSWDDIEVTPPEQIRYDFAAPVPEGTEPGEDVRIRTFEELRVGVARATGDLPRVAAVWDHLYHDWLPASRWEPADLPSFERYLEWPEKLDWNHWELDCCIPLTGWRA